MGFSLHLQKISKIIPDGCRDLIFWSRPGQKPNWAITALDCRPHFSQMEHGAELVGFRLQPGTLIKAAELIKSMGHLEADPKRIMGRIEDFCTLPPSINEALSCIGAPQTTSVQHAAKQLGVNIRTLQRLIGAPTGRTPARWLALARARRAARLIAKSANLAETAYKCGYSDQAHMSRELRRWFETGPSKLHLETTIGQQLADPGYY